MSGQYVIKGYHWGYNDETFYPEGGFIHDVFTDKGKAKTELIQLERRHWRQMDLSETHVLFDGDKNTIAELNDFTMEKLQTEFDDSGSPVHVPPELSDEDFMQFLAIADIRAYKLIETDNEPEFWAIWIVEDEDYLTAGEDERLVFAESVDQLKDELEQDPWSLTYLAEESEAFEGTLKEISKSPTLLKELIATHKSITYADGSLGIDEDDIGAHFAVNELLKDPIFKLKKLSLDELKELQGFTSSSPASEFEQDVQSMVSDGMADIFLNALGGLLGSNSKSNETNKNAFSATHLTDEIVQSIFDDIAEQEKKFSVDGVMKHISRDFKAKITTRENGKSVTMPLTYSLYKITLKMAMQPKMEFKSHETIEKIEIKNDTAYVTTSAHGQCIDPIEKKLATSDTKQYYELAITEGKVCITSLVMEDNLPG